MEAESLPASTTLGRVQLGVGDRNRVADFYESVIGLSRIETGGDATVLGAGDRPLLVVESRPDLPERRRDEAGLFHVALRVPTREALGDALARITDRWDLDGASDHGVSEALYLRDPAGNGVEVYRDRPREDWPVDADGRVTMTTEPLDVDAVRGAGAGGETAPPATTVGHVHLEVTDVAAARAFYVDALGLSIRQALGRSALFVAAGDYHHHVGLNAWNDRSAPRSGRGLGWFELVVDDAGVVDRAATRCERSGFDVTRVERGIEVADPDDIDVRVVH